MLWEKKKKHSLPFTKIGEFISADLATSSESGCQCLHACVFKWIQIRVCVCVWLNRSLCCK